MILSWEEISEEKEGGGGEWSEGKRRRGLIWEGEERREISSWL